MTHETWHYFIGDIHGCFGALQRLEQRIHQHAERHHKRAKIISVGDLVDRGKHSNLVIAHFRRGQKQGTHAAILGNHDIMFLNALWSAGPKHDAFDQAPAWCETFDIQYERQKHKPFGYASALELEEFELLRQFMWLGQGGHQTLLSYDCDPKDTASWHIPEEDLSFLLQLPLIWENEHFITTHALASMQAIEFLNKMEHPQLMDEEEHMDYLRAVHEITWSRKPSKTWDDTRVHISGHTVVPKATWKKHKRMLQIDTGCVFGKRLTAWCGERNEFLRVEATSR